MESLAQIVALMFAAGSLTGPLACLFAWFRLPILTSITSACAAVCGLVWFEAAPWPIGAVGLLNGFLGALAAFAVLKQQMPS